MYNNATMDKNVEYLTRSKFNEFSKELKELKTIKRKEIAEQLNYARSLGDLSENAEYKEAREKQGAMESRIRELDAIVENAEIIKGNKSGIAELGSEVSLAKGTSKEKITYTIVGSAEADMASMKISHESPLGSSMMGKEKGDSFELTTPGGKMKYKIIKVS
jgi:transcription elongation factor GreA